MMRRWQRRSLWIFCILGLPGGTATYGADWQPAKGPLMTRWAKGIQDDKPHPEYPRPQLRRQRWLNLNGLWQFSFAKKDDPVPVGKDLPERILVPFPVESVSAAF